MLRDRLTRRDFLRTTAAGFAALTLGGRSAQSPDSPPRGNPIIYFTKFLRGLAPEEIAKTVKGMGFDGLDLAVRAGQYVNPNNVREALPGAMSVWREAGLSVPMVSTETSLVDPQQRTVEPIFAACAEAGIKDVKIGYWVWREGQSYWGMVDRARRDLEAFAELSQKHGVRTLVHNHSGPYLACNASTLMTLLRDLDPAHVGAYIDPAHLSINGEPLALALEIVGSHLAMVAVKNAAYVARDAAAGRRWRTEWCLLQDGLVDWREAIALLRKRGYAGPLSLHGEYSGPEDRSAILKNVARDVSFLRSIVE
jgi:sugar phosphate isomerase/epimerase